MQKSVAVGLGVSSVVLVMILLNSFKIYGWAAQYKSTFVLFGLIFGMVAIVIDIVALKAKIWLSADDDEERYISLWGKLVGAIALVIVVLSSAKDLAGDF